MTASATQQRPQAPGSIEDVAGDVATLQELQIPLGWSLEKGDAQEIPRDVSGWIAKLVGLLVTAAALTFGAPFWFDLLKRVAQVRSAGPARRAKRA